MTSITVNLPDDVNNALKLGAAQQMISKAALVRILLANHVRGERSNPADGSNVIRKGGSK